MRISFATIARNTDVTGHKRGIIVECCMSLDSRRPVSLSWRRNPTMQLANHNQAHLCFPLHDRCPCKWVGETLPGGCRYQAALQSAKCVLTKLSWWSNRQTGFPWHGSSDSCIPIPSEPSPCFHEHVSEGSPHGKSTPRLYDMTRFLRCRLRRRLEQPIVPEDPTFAHHHNPHVRPYLSHPPPGLAVCHRCSLFHHTEKRCSCSLTNVDTPSPFLSLVRPSSPPVSFLSPLTTLP